MRKFVKFTAPSIPGSIYGFRRLLHFFSTSHTVGFGLLVGGLEFRFVFEVQEPRIQGHSAVPKFVKFTAPSIPGSM